jgi:hypothetical protein
MKIMKKKLRIFSLLIVFYFTFVHVVGGNADNLNLLKTQQNPVKITGKVLDAGTGEALIGVSVVEKGTGNGMATDGNGGFSLTVGKPLCTSKKMNMRVPYGLKETN